MEKLKITEADLSPPSIMRATGDGTTSASAPGPTTGIKLAMLPLVALLPILCLMTFAALFSLKDKEPQTRESWFRFMSMLLAISGLIYTVVGGVLYFSNDTTNTTPPPISSIKPKPLIKKINHLPRFDGQSLDSEILYQKIKPLIFAASPIVHRDLKPGNLLVDQDGSVKVAVDQTDRSSLE